MTGFFEPLLLLKLVVARILLNLSTAFATALELRTKTGRLWDMIGYDRPNF